MKKIFSLIIVTILTLGLAADGYCQSPLRKLGRGLANVVTCPFEVPKNMIDSYNKNLGFVESIFLGLPKGIGMTVVRCASGLYETVTFPLPAPAGYEPVLQPEFTWGPERDEGANNSHIF